MKNKILNKFNLTEDKIVNIYPFGSRVYGTFTEKSDYDFWVIYKNNVYNNLFAETRENISIHLYDENTFQEFLNKNNISALECAYLPKELLLKYTNPFKFSLDIKKLRDYIADKSTRDIKQAELRFGKGDYYMGKKALFHALRIRDYANQIIRFNKITNYSAKPIWNTLFNNSSTCWDDYRKLIKSITSD